MIFTATLAIRVKTVQCSFRLALGNDVRWNHLASSIDARDHYNHFTVSARPHVQVLAPFLCHDALCLVFQLQTGFIHIPDLSWFFLQGLFLSVAL